MWQRNYYEHIIRDRRALERIRAYVCANPATWTAAEGARPLDPLDPRPDA